MKKQGWFSEWFDTEYYHLLYRRRDDEEAGKFIRSIVNRLDLKKGDTVADIACGKGRHSRVMAGLGFEVYGFDLSENNIHYAQKHASGSEHFEIHDIREPYNLRGVRAAMNLFTSFGYFDKRSEDVDALKNIYDMLIPGGYFVQDYINGPPVKKNLPFESSEKCSGLNFKIVKTWQEPFVVKNITVEKPDGSAEFMEKVKLYSMEEMLEMHSQCGFVNLDVFGNYELGPYEAESSPRLILISQKPNA